MDKKIPEIRFKGFTDDWEQRKLGDISPLRGGFAFKSSEFRNNGVPIVRISNILSSGEVGGNFAYYDEQDKDDKYILPDKSAILAMSGATTGKVSILSKTNDNKVYQNQRVGYFQPVEGIDYGFISTIVRSELFMQQLDSVLVSGAQPNVSSKEIDSFEFVIPKVFHEQQKIGSFFKQLDNTIALHQRKLDLLKEQKKGFLQKMFPKAGEKIPELRFKGFTDDWEQRKFKDIIEKLNGGASISPNDYKKQGVRTIPKGAVNDTGIADLSGSKFISKEFFDTNITSHVSNFDLVTSLRDLVPSAPNLGRIVRIEGDSEDFLMPQGVYKLKLFKNMDENFLITYSNSFFYRKIISQEKNGSTQVHLRNGEFLNIKIDLPSFEEQRKIGSFFKKIDNTLALHQRKLDLLKKQKKGFLQKMFI